ncbi:Zinc finger, CCHC-type domain-containing protein [Strongyloides ratti]|uniref:Zinc finger, CCHC-type domain-containing protein n=1 Tax=Strongyloides ratti TaxID=34506 RepID=A0A090MZJ9_STRRB|nr:Zinc finger, CCHC-type domain-containing protein [Strongyloides ratti]CEF69064.1 Zinc finger, CCHC-type domain-containing protein [Strongyloides ratti]
MVYGSMMIEKFNGRTSFKDFIQSLECLFTLNDVETDGKKLAMLVFHLGPEVREVVEQADEDERKSYENLKNWLENKFNDKILALRARDEVKYYKIDYRDFEKSLRKLLKLISTGFASFKGKELMEVQLSWLMQKLDGAVYDRLYNNSYRYTNTEELVDDLVYAYRHANKRNGGNRRKDFIPSEKNDEKSTTKVSGMNSRKRLCYICQSEEHLANKCPNKVVKQEGTNWNANLVQTKGYQKIAGPTYRIEFMVGDEKIKIHCDSGTPISVMTRKCADNLKLTIEKVQDVDMVAKGVANGELLIKGIVSSFTRVMSFRLKTFSRYILRHISSSRRDTKTRPSAINSSEKCDLEKTLFSRPTFKEKSNETSPMKKFPPFAVSRFKIQGPRSNNFYISISFLDTKNDDKRIGRAKIPNDVSQEQLKFRKHFQRRP